MFGLYSIIAIMDHEQVDEIDNLFLPIHILTIVESTIQSGFLVNAMKMYTPDKQMRKTKPGRSLMTSQIRLPSNDTSRQWNLGKWCQSHVRLTLQLHALLTA